MKHIHIFLPCALLLLALCACVQMQTPEIPAQTDEQTEQITTAPETESSTTQTEQQTQSPSEEQTTQHTHTVVLDPAVPATCTQTGLTEGSHCSTCGEVLTAQVTLPVNDQHKALTVPAQAATCTQEGLSDYQYCEYCNVRITEPEIYAPLGHALEITPGYPASCSDPGLTDKSYCPRCRTVVNEHTEIPSLAHQYDADGVCTVCKYPTVSTGLEFTQPWDGVYFVSGIGTCTDTDIVIPTVYRGDPVIGILYDAFKNCTHITSVKMYDNIKTIGTSAFSGCTSLSHVALSPNVTELDSRVFDGCISLLEIDVSNVQTFRSNCFTESYFSHVTIPDNASIKGPIFYDSHVQSVTIGSGISAIPYNTFWGCKELTHVELSEGVTQIGHSAFRNSGITSITLPSTLVTIDEEAFYGCSKLETVDFSNASVRFYSNTFDGCNVTCFENWTGIVNKSLLDYEKLEGVQWVRNMLIGHGWVLTCKTDTSGVLTVPEGIGAIQDNAFRNCTQITEILLPDTLRTIGNGAFSGCSDLTQMVLPEGVIAVGDNALQDCTSLSYLYLPDSLKQLQKLQIPTDQEITISIGAQIEAISDGVLADIKNMHRIVFRGTVQEWKSFYPALHTQAFSHVTIQCDDGEIIQKIASFTLSGTSIDVTLTSDGVCTVQGNGAVPYFDARFYFKPHLVTKLVIGEGITEVQSSMYGASSFSQCTQIAEIVIPSTLTVFHKQSFAGSIWYESFNAGSEPLYIQNTLCMVPAALQGSFQVKDGTVSIAAGAFSGCANLTEIILPQSLESIGDSAFRGCESLEKLELPEGITHIGYTAIFDCHSLSELTIPASLSKIGLIIYNCDSLEKIVLADRDAATIESVMVTECDNLHTVIFGKGITQLPSYVVHECPNLQYVILRDTVTYMGGQAFWHSSTAPAQRKLLCYDAQTAELSEMHYPGYVYTYSETAPEQPGNYWGFDADGKIVIY